MSGAIRIGPWAIHERLAAAMTLIRYRFFLFAGILPYFLGASWAVTQEGRFDPPRFWIGLLGIGLAIIGVETFNDFFDSQMGTDRVFNPVDVPLVPRRVFWLGSAAFAGALAIGAGLTLRAGWPILAFALAGGIAAVFYEAPPLRWSFRGLGEFMIAMAYGPAMVLGSLYLHAEHVSAAAALASLVPALPIAALAVANAVPDFHQDRLVGKRNLVVRLGRRRGVLLSLMLAAGAPAIVLLGVAAGLFPVAAMASWIGLFPFAAFARDGLRFHDAPRRFLGAIRALIIFYLLTVFLFTAGLFLGQGA